MTYKAICPPRKGVPVFNAGAYPLIYGSTLKYSASAKNSGKRRVQKYFIRTNVNLE